MTYSEAVAYIHSLLVFGMKPGLSRISALLSELGDPQNDLKFVHVAGTNGKGTTSNMLSRILVEAGYKTGLFTSPYVFSFCERIQVNHQNISESALAETVSIVRDAIERLNRRGIVPTEFEAITAAALLYFKNAGCDIAVMEVGLGGRFDSTNIIPCPEVCVITSISLDHTKVLGDTIAKIAFEKAGIIKEGGVTVTTNRQEFDALQVIQNTAAEKTAVVPNIIGKTAAQANKALTDAGFNIHLTGATGGTGAVAVSQSLPAGTITSKGTVITVDFRHMDTAD